MGIARAAGISRGNLPVILGAAVVHGWAMYGLHVAVKGQYWPASSPAWLFGLYALAVFIPATVQLLAEHARDSRAWPILAILSAAFFYFGWHYGAWIAEQPVRDLNQVGSAIPTGFVLLVLWLMLMPFVQARLALGHWRVQYQTLFAIAWRNKVTLAEAVLFTGLFWLLLFLWQMLFHMLGMGFFRELFTDPAFAYPVTALCFGLALWLIGSVDSLTAAVLAQLLNVLKWLAILAGLILALFTVALLFKLPGLVSSGERAIGAAWLLWLVAVTVLLMNAAYRDGSVRQPYPAWIGIALRMIVPLTVVISATAIYALYVRIATYGFTVERVWATIVAGTALLYSIGYAISAWRGDGWMTGMARVNVAVAVLLIATIALTLTPVLSPHRIAANSQYERAQRSSADTAELEYPQQRTPFLYLRFDAGRYGTAKLSELADLQDHPRAAEIRQAASRVIEQKTPWEAPVPPNVGDRVADIEVYPAGRSLDDSLGQSIQAQLQRPEFAWLLAQAGRFAGLYVDLDGDRTEEFVLFADHRALAFELAAGDWQWAGTMTSKQAQSRTDHLRHLASGNVSTAAQRWRELIVGQATYRIVE